MALPLYIIIYNHELESYEVWKRSEHTADVPLYNIRLARGMKGRPEAKLVLKAFEEAETNKQEEAIDG